MKLTLFLLIICMLCSSFLSCSNTTPLDESAAATTTAATADSDESTPPSSPFFFFGAGAEGSLAQANGNPKQYGVETETKMLTEEKLIGTSVMPFADGKKYIYEQSKRTLKATKDDEYGSFYSHILVYKNEEDQRVELLAGTDLIVGFSQTAYSAAEKDTMKVLSEEDLRKCAEEFIRQYTSEDYFSTLDFEGITQITDQFWTVGYWRRIEGYVTDETVTVIISDVGQIIQYGGDIQKFDSLLPQITKDKLDDAHARLLAQLGAFECKVTPVGSPILTTGTSGELYLYVSYSYVDANGNETIQRLYTNVN